MKGDQHAGAEQAAGVVLADAVPDLARALADGAHGVRVGRVRYGGVAGVEGVQGEGGGAEQGVHEDGAAEGQVGEAVHGVGDVGVLGLERLHEGGEGHVVVEEAQLEEAGGRGGGGGGWEMRWWRLHCLMDE